ncbi:hypothetical protein EV426DRAFT_608723 [Tirmania nivea]|nr:hypothetical protein EV426DRAFT_608723 [Tirmania nivea]
MPPNSQKGARQRIWTKEEVERLVCWMEENQESLRGKQAVWHKDVKAQVFAEDEEMTVTRIRDKAHNMKKAWSEARKLREQSGSGVRAEDQVSSFNVLLESKCPLFWRLDEIWGTRPNVTPILIADSTQDSTQQEPTKQEPTQQADDLSDDEDFEWEDTSPPANIPISISTASSSSSESKISKKIVRDKGADLQKIMADRRILDLEKEDKRIQLEREIQKERIAAEDRRLERQLEVQERIAKIQAEAQVKQAEIQAEAQAKQFQTFIQMMAMVVKPPHNPESQ